MARLPFLVRSLLGWYRRNARKLPWRLTTDPYAIWISEVMLQQTQVRTVIPYWNRWMRRFPSIRSLARAKVSEVLRCWAGLGYYTRARNLQSAARLIVSNHVGNFPRNFGDIIALPGVGRYTAGAICSIAFNQPAPVLDGNVTRVLARIFGITTDPKETRTKGRLWDLAQHLVSHAAKYQKPKTRPCADLNQALMELGATVCTPRQPQCPKCPCRRYCRARKEHRVAEIPAKTVRPKSLHRWAAAFAINRDGRFLVRQRSSGEINAYLWEFPNLETNSPVSKVQSVAHRCLGFRPRSIQPFCVVAHTIMRHRIRLEVFTGTTNGPWTGQGRNARWCTLKQLHQLAFPSAHRKILQALEAKAGPQKPPR
ncbi:MAG: A/G-specific adenine glycosylase [Verrucomicrobia bacterium]|nr:A/G-specific adenine glycosylase [Verrucomicrobiota bacterium]